ncbi:MFS transporter [Cytobacillus purgationiresistens]|uniref:MFS family permease n=1 Tax=Cytobacillus purgationiresistens TaxID=863449 RepID=A0ABU0AL23_9BACI|nr:MFS transporter [Cytobacillus purgationiresistens]MDQ0271477.1 MFS family permease [Cytobacillus purgationiresistens]
MITAVRNNLILFMIGKFTAVLGSSVFGFAIGLYILAETGSSLSFAITLVLSTLPRILLSPLAGTLADRMDRKKIIITTDFACAIWLGIIFVLFNFVYSEIWVLYLAAAVLGILNTFYSSAVTSAIHNMVGADYLQKAFSLNQAAVSLSTILGPVLGGILFAMVPIETFMLINTITFIISGIASVLIKYNLFAEEKVAAAPSSVLQDIKSGFVYVKNQPFIFNLIFISVWLNFWFAIFPVAMPYLVLQIRGMQAYQLGIIEGTFSVGMLIMAVILSTRGEIKRKDRAITIGLIILPITLILMGMPDLPALMGISNAFVFPYLMILVFVLSAFIMLINMPVMVLLQKSTPDTYRGRVTALLEMGATAMTPLGYILFGAILDKFPLWITMTVCGLGIIGMVAYHLWRKTFFVHMNELENREVKMAIAEKVQV